MTAPVASPAVPPPPVASSASRGWIESGLDVVAWPVAIAAGLMFAPFAWVLVRRR